MARAGCGPKAGTGGRLPNGGSVPDLTVLNVVGLDGGTRPDPDLLFDNDAFWAEDPPPRGPPELRPRLALPLKRGIAPGIPRADRRPRGRRRRREFYCPSERKQLRW